MSKYVASRGAHANAFITVSAHSSDEVMGVTAGMSQSSTEWLAIYNYEWEDDSGEDEPSHVGYYDGECDNRSCYYMCDAHSLNFLTRVYDIDDPLEADMSVGAGDSRSRIGWANFVAMDRPDRFMYFPPIEDPDSGHSGYGNHPFGIYHWNDAYPMSDGC